MRRTSKDLKELQSLPLSRKIGIAQARIAEFYNYFNGNVYISFSGGKDSTVLLHIARAMYPEIEAVYCDTGLEYPEIKEFVKSQENITIIRPDKGYNTIIKEYGYPVISKMVSQAVGIMQRQKARGNLENSKVYINNVVNGNNSKLFNYSKYKNLIDAPFKVSSQCCNELKKKPFKKFNKINGKYPITGQIAEESVLRRNIWLSHGCNLFDTKEKISNPLSVWTNQDILRYIYIYKLNIASIYGDVYFNGIDYKLSGVQRTGCMWCVYGAHLEKEPNRFQLMQDSHPQIYDYVINKLNFKEVLNYLNIPYKKKPNIWDLLEINKEDKEL